MVSCLTIGQLTIFREYIGTRKFNETTTWALNETNANLVFEHDFLPCLALFNLSHQFLIALLTFDSIVLT